MYKHVGHFSSEGKVLEGNVPSVQPVNGRIAHPVWVWVPVFSPEELELVSYWPAGLALHTPAHSLLG